MRTQVVVAYGAALLQGLTVVSFPASATVLKGEYGLDDAGYGSLFLPQMALTIAGSLLGAALSSRVGLRALLVLATICAVGAEVALASVVALDPGTRLSALLAGTAMMGLGFGLSAAPLNAYPGLLFPEGTDGALVALHTSMGAGFALGPLAVSALVSAGAWALFPIGLAGASALLAITAGATVLPIPPPPDPARSSASARPPALLLPIFLGIAVLYAFAEGTFASWAAIFLHEDRAVPDELAALALSGFWAAIAMGRLLVAGLVARVGAERIWIGLLVAMAVAFLAIPLASGAVTGIALFVIAGLACSAFFPLTVGLASKRASDAARASSLLIAALMIGVGTSSFALGALRERLALETIYRVSTIYPALALLLAPLALRRLALAR